MMTKNSLLLLPALVLLGWTSCTDPITVGSDLLEDDRIEVSFDADVPIRTRTIAMDTFSVYDVGTNSLWPQIPFGRVSDDVFGTASMGTHLYFRPSRTSGSVAEIEVPEFVVTRDSAGVSLDSVVILLAVDTNSIRGQAEGSMFDYRLSELLSRPEFEEDILLTERFETGDVVGQGSFELNKTARLLADTLIRADSLVAVHQRFRLDQSFVDRLADLDVSDFESDSTFAEAFPGLFLEAVSETDGIFNFEMRNVSYDGMIAYYTDTVGNYESYQFLPLRWLPSVERERSGTVAEMLLDADADDEVTLVESMGGLLTEINLTDPDVFADRIVNLAQLEIYPAEPMGFDASRFPPPPTVMLFARDEDGRLQLIDDLSRSVLVNQSLNNIRFFIGGVLDEDADPPHYEVNMSVQLQRIIDGEADPVVYLAVLPRIYDPATFLSAELDLEYARLPLNGPAAATNPMRLRVAFTRL